MRQRDRRSEHERSYEPRLVASGSYADVYLVGEALSGFDGLALSKGDQDAMRASVNLPKYFRRFAETGPSALNDKMFKKLMDVKVGNGNSVPVFEFKNYQARIYGVICNYKGRRAFVGTACDLKKKQQKADSAVIARAASEFGKVQI